MVTRNDSLWKTLDWVTIFIYLLLIVGGWFSVCGASYDYGERDFLDFSTRAGKQFVWIICSFGLGFVLLMLEDRMYDMFAYIIYVGMILLLIVTIFIAPDTKGSRSWLVMGPVSLQPAEFAKFGVGQIHEFLFIQYQERKVCLYPGIHHSSPDVIDYRSAGDRVCISLSCFFSGSLS